MGVLALGCAEENPVVAPPVARIPPVVEGDVFEGGSSDRPPPVICFLVVNGDTLTNPNPDARCADLYPEVYPRVQCPLTTHLGESPVTLYRPKRTRIRSMPPPRRNG